jgi:hypothetical protein
MRTAYKKEKAAGQFQCHRRPLTFPKARLGGNACGMIPYFDNSIFVSIARLSESVAFSTAKSTTHSHR